MIGSVKISELCAIWTMDIGKVNGFGRDEIRELDFLIEGLANKFPNEIRLLCIKSEKVSPGGHRIFCAGANQKQREKWSSAEKLKHLAYQRAVVHRLRRVPFYAASFVDGLAIGLGVELCLASDFVFAAPGSRFSFPEVGLGIVPGAGGYAWAHHWAKHRGESQKWISESGSIGPEYAQRLGVVDVCCEREDFDNERKALIGMINRMTPEEQRMRKAKRWEQMDFDSWFEEEQAEYAARLVQKKKIMS